MGRLQIFRFKNAFDKIAQRKLLWMMERSIKKNGWKTS